MALNNNKELYVKRIKQFLYYGGLLFLTIFNVIKFCEFQDSNPNFLIDYKTPVDELKYFKNPLIATAYLNSADDIKILILPNAVITHPFVKYKKILTSKYDEIILIDKKDILYEQFLKKILPDSKNDIKKVSVSATLFNRTNGLIVAFDDINNQSQTLQFIKDYATKHKLKPKTFDLLNIKKSYDMLNLNTEYEKQSLTEQQKNLKNFILDHNVELKNFIANPNKKTKLSPHFYDKTSSIVLACTEDESVCEEFGNFNFEKSFKSSLIQNLEQANEKYPTYKKKIYLLTEFEKQKFNNEEAFLTSIDTSTGVFLKIGFRQALMLPDVWNKCEDKQEFIKRLKLKAGLSPTYWDNNINIYYFKAVEI